MRDKLGRLKKGHKFIKGGEKGWFKKGHKSINPIKKGEHRGKKTEFKKGHKSVCPFKKNHTFWLGKKRLNMSKENHPNWKDGKKFSGGYIFILKPKHPRSNKQGYVKRANLVIEKHLGRYLKKGEMVHHKNGNKTDDKRRNLKLCKNGSEHQLKYHRHRNRVENMKTLILTICMLFLISGRAFAYTDTEIVNAIYQAEGGLKATYLYGIRSVKYDTPEEARQICLNTVRNNRERFKKQSTYKNYLDFLSSRYCPIGASNDPQGLNKNWLKNVRYFLDKEALCTN